MRNSKTSSVAILILLATIGGCKQPNAPQSLTVTGMVFPSTTPPGYYGEQWKDGGADVFVEELGVHVTTNNSGYYSIPNIPAGKYSFVFSHSGFATEKLFQATISASNVTLPYKYLYTFQPEFSALIDSVLLKDTVFTIYTITGVQVDSKGDTTNHGKVTSTTFVTDTNIIIKGHMQSSSANNPSGWGTAVVYFGLTPPNPLDTITFLSTEPIHSSNQIPLDSNFVVELYATRTHFWPTDAPSGSKVYVAAFATPFTGPNGPQLSYSDSLYRHEIYPMFNQPSANVMSFIMP